MAKPKQVKKDITLAQVDKILKDLGAVPDRKMQLAKSKRIHKSDMASAAHTLAVQKRNASKSSSRASKEIRPVQGKNSNEQSTKYLNQAENANKETRELGGNQPKKDKSLFNRAVDVISRGNYGAAEAFKRGFNPNDNKKYDFGGAVKGFKSGLEGKSKTRYGDILKEHGNTGKGMGTLGFALDVFGDPLTYTGLGLVSKAARGKQIVKGLEDTAEVVGKAVKGGKNRDDVVKALQVDRVAVRNVSKRQINKASPEAKALYDMAKEVQKATGTTYRAKGATKRGLGRTVVTGAKGEPDILAREIVENLAKDSYATVLKQARKEAEDVVAKETGVKLGRGLASPTDIKVPKGSKFKSPGGKAGVVTVGKVGYATSDQAALAKRIGTLTDENMIKKGFGKSVDEFHKDVVAATVRNLNPGVKNNLAIRVGTKRVTVPLAADLARKSIQIAGKPEFVRKTSKALTDNFSAKAHIPDFIRQSRAAVYGTNAQLNVAYGRHLKSVFDAVPPEARKNLALSIGRGNTEGMTPIPGGVSAITNAPVEDAGKHLMEQLESLATSVRKSGLSSADVNKRLGDKRLSLAEIREVGGVKEIITRNAKGKIINIKKMDTNSPTPDFFMEGMRSALASGKIDPVNALFEYNAAVNNAVAEKALWETLSQAHGVPIRKANGYKDRLAAELLKGDETAKWRVPLYNGKPIHGMDNFVFEPEVARGIERMADIFSSSKSTGQFIDVYDRSLMSLKAVLTRYNPSFHPRTFMGEVVLGYVGGMRNLPGSYSKAAKTMRGRGNDFLGKGDGVPTGPASKQMKITSNMLRGAEPTVGGTNASVFRHKQFGNVTADTIWHEFMVNGLKSGIASSDMVRGVANTVGGSKLRRFSDATQTGTEAVEDFGRLAHFIDAIQYSKSATWKEAVEEAAMAVRKAHLDYTEVTGMEKSVAARIVPFYKWLRLSTPLMAEMLLTQPGKVTAIPKLMDALSKGSSGFDPAMLGVLPGGPDAAVPEYLTDAGARPMFSIDGNTQWFNPTALFPLAGSSELVESGAGNPATALMNVVNPALGAVAELGLDSQSKGSKPSENYAKYAASQTPQTGFVRKMFSNEDPSVGNIEKTLKFLGNPGFISNTPRTIEGAAYQERKKAHDNRREEKRKLGLLEPKK